jgi:transposase
MLDPRPTLANGVENLLRACGVGDIRRRQIDGVDAPSTASLCQSGDVAGHSREASMESVHIVGLDLAKHVFQAHGADQSGAVIFRKKLRRQQVLSFFSDLPRCTVAMEACAGAHYWGREIGKLGHCVKLIAPAYVKPFVKRQKNDASDAEAICEAAQRPTMRFVAVKTEEAQAAAIIFRTRDLLVRQRTQIINALRGHLTEFGIIVAKGPQHAGKLIALVNDSATDLPNAARDILKFLTEELNALNARVANLDREIARRAKEDSAARRLMTIPGIGAITAAALSALAPPTETFKRGRDFAAWLGLTPLQRSTGGKERLGRTSRMGERTLRRLLIIGASAVASWKARKGAPAGSWLDRMLTRKPPMLVRVALANKMARIAWAILSKGEIYRAPILAM